MLHKTTAYYAGTKKKGTQSTLKQKDQTLQNTTETKIAINGPNLQNEGTTGIKNSCKLE